jgi:hypothetical protein
MKTLYRRIYSIVHITKTIFVDIFEIIIFLEYTANISINSLFLLTISSSLFIGLFLVFARTFAAYSTASKREFSFVFYSPFVIASNGYSFLF